MISKMDEEEIAKRENATTQVLGIALHALGETLSILLNSGDFEKIVILRKGMNDLFDAAEAAVASASMKARVSLN